MPKTPKKSCKYGLSDEISPKTGKRLCNKKPSIKKSPKKECKYGLSDQISPKTGKRLCNKKPVAKKTTPKKASPKKTTPKKASPKKTTPKKTTPKKTTPKKTTTPKKANKIYEQYSFTDYIHELLFKIQPDINLTESSISELNSILHKLVEKLTRESTKFTNASKKQVISARYIQEAVRELFPPNLSKYVVNEATRSNIIYLSTANNYKNPKTDVSERARLVFPVLMVDTLMRNYTDKNRITIEGLVYFTSVLEHVTGEILKLATNIAKNNGENIIDRKDINFVIDSDRELNQLINSIY